MKKPISFLFLLVFSGQASALDQIIHPFTSTRSEGMGGLLLTTGLYEENFYGNPARVCANPKFKFTIFDPSIEVNSGAVSNVGTVIGNAGNISNMITALAPQATGTNNHMRITSSFPAVYIPTGRFSIAFGLLTNTQFDADLRQNAQIYPQATIDAGVGLTLGYKFLQDNAMSLGLGTHVDGRFQTNGAISLAQLLSSTLPPFSKAAGANIDFDLGFTYLLPWSPLKDFEMSVAGTVNNVLGGTMNNFVSITPDNTAVADSLNRIYGLGVALRRAAWGHMTNNVFALELRDMGNNGSGSFYRLIHLGGETHYGRIAARLGLNQGYPSFGMGIDLRVLTIDAAAYGEEMSYNAGYLEDWRYAIRIAFQI